MALRFCICALAFSFAAGICPIWASNIWDGGGGSDRLITSGSNWADDVPPNLESGNQTLTFGTGGTLVNLNVPVNVSGLILNRASSMTFTPLAPVNFFSVGSGGIVAQPSSNATVTHTFVVSGSVAPLQLVADQVWTIENSGSSTTTVSVGVIGGNFNLTKNGSGILALTANSSRSSEANSVILNNGVLRLQASSALNLSPSAPFFLNGGELRLATNSDTTFNGTNITIGGNASITTSRSSGSEAHPIQSINFVSVGAHTLSVRDANVVNSTGNATLQVGLVSLTGNAVFNVVNTDNLGVLSLGTLSGIGGFSKSGDGTLIITGSSTYSGPTTLAAGMLGISNPNALGISGNITFSGGMLHFGVGAAPDISSRIRNSSSAITIDTNGENATFASAINASNTQGITKLGAGSITFSGNNTYNGTTTVRSGGLRYIAGGRFDDPWGADSNLIVGAFGGDNGLFSVSGGFVRIYDLTLGNGTASTGTLAIDSGDFVSNHNVFIANTANSTGSFNITGGNVGWTYAFGVGYFGSGNLNISGGSLSGATGAPQSGQLRIGWYNGSNGTLVMTGGSINASDSSIGEASGSRGSANVSGGTWNISGNLSVGISGNASLAISGSGRVVVGGTLTRNATRGSISLQAGGTLQIGNGGNSGALGTDLSNNGTLVFDGSGTDIHTNLISGNGSVFKNGNGTLSLTANNTYSGETQINGGTLLITGTLAPANSTIVVGQAGTLGGSGLVGRSVEISGGLSPGNGSQSTANFTISGNLTLSANATVFIALNGTTRGTEYDALAIGGSLVCGGGLHFEIGNSFLAEGQSFQIFNVSANTTTGLGSVTFGGAYGVGEFTSAGGGNWTQNLGGLSLFFSESSGVLTVGSAVAPPTITSATLASATVGSSFAYQTTVTPNVLTTFSANSLPQGLSMNSTTGFIGGTPDTVGNFTVSIVATNSGGSSGNFSLEIAVGPAPTPYEQWATSYFLSGADADPIADPDGDSFVNQQEYSFGTNPTIPDGELIATSSVGGNMEVLFNTRSNLTYNIQSSDNLADIPFSNNSTLTGLVQTSADQNGVPPPYIRKQLIIPITGHKNFYRVMATD